MPEKYLYENPWTDEELKILDKLKTPYLIQEFIDSTSYSDDHFYRSPRSVLRDRKAHCVDGAFFAASALRRLGYPPVIMEMTAFRDDDHVIAIYKRNGLMGAVAKSNFSGIRFREPVFKTLRELVLSYFEFYYNVEGEKTLRGYSGLLSLEQFDKINWMTDDNSIEPVINKLEKSRHYPIMTEGIVKILSPVDKRSYDAGLLGVNEAGLYRPDKM
ncbi:MAG: hypothetical protein ABRQ39_11920 [Candidatus Eremiobacterota bacterium]